MKKIVILSLIFFSISLCDELEYVYKSVIPSATDTPTRGMFRFSDTYSRINSEIYAYEKAIDYYGHNASGLTFTIHYLDYMQNTPNETSFSNESSTITVDFGYYWMWNDINDVPFRSFPMSFHHDGTFSSTRIKTGLGYSYDGDVGNIMLESAFDFIIGSNAMLTARVKYSAVSLLNVGIICSMDSWLGWPEQKYKTAIKTEYLASSALDHTMHWIGFTMGIQFNDIPLGHHTFNLNILPKFYMAIDIKDQVNYNRIDLGIIIDFI